MLAQRPLTDLAHEARIRLLVAERHDLLEQRRGRTSLRADRGWQRACRLHVRILGEPRPQVRQTAPTLPASTAGEPRLAVTIKCALTVRQLRPT
jgi:hypothetical protein